MSDLDFSGYFRAFPFGIILFDFLFLLVAIPIEAYILNKRLKFDKRTSAFYAISINVFSKVIGWIIFFLIEPNAVFEDYKLGLINFLLYNRVGAKLYSSIVLTAFITFFGTLLVKFGLLRLLILALSDPGEKKAEPEPENSVLSSRKMRQSYKKTFQSTSLLTTALIANSLSYSAITLVVLFRIFVRTNAS